MQAAKDQTQFPLITQALLGGGRNTLGLRQTY
jgi:hypothetical protein